MSPRLPDSLASFLRSSALDMVPSCASGHPQICARSRAFSSPEPRHNQTDPLMPSQSAAQLTDVCFRQNRHTLHLNCLAICKRRAHNQLSPLRSGSHRRLRVLRSRLIQGGRHMPKNLPPPTCSKCGKPMRFMLVETGGRKFRCNDCDVPDPLRLLLVSESRRPE